MSSITLSVNPCIRSPDIKLLESHRQKLKDKVFFRRKRSVSDTEHVGLYRRVDLNYLQDVREGMFPLHSSNFPPKYCNNFKVERFSCWNIRKRCKEFFDDTESPLPVESILYLFFNIPLMYFKGNKFIRKVSVSPCSPFLRYPRK